MQPRSPQQAIGCANPDQLRRSPVAHPRPRAHQPPGLNSPQDETSGARRNHCAQKKPPKSPNRSFGPSNVGIPTGKAAPYRAFSRAWAFCPKVVDVAKRTAAVLNMAIFRALEGDTFKS